MVGILLLLLHFCLISYPSNYVFVVADLCPRSQLPPLVLIFHIPYTHLCGLHTQSYPTIFLSVFHTIFFFQRSFPFSLYYCFFRFEFSLSSSHPQTISVSNSPRLVHYRCYTNSYTKYLFLIFSIVPLHIHVSILVSATLCGIIIICQTFLTSNHILITPVKFIFQSH